MIAVILLLEHDDHRFTLMIAEVPKGSLFRMEHVVAVQLELRTGCEIAIQTADEQILGQGRRGVQGAAGVVHCRDFELRFLEGGRGTYVNNRFFIGRLRRKFRS